MGKQILNGVLYGSGEIIKFSPYIYNTNEREIGVYVDGKPLYQKSFVGTVQNIAKGTAVTIATITNIDSIANVRGGYVYNFTDTQIYVGIGTYCSVEFNELTNTLSFRQDWTSHTSGTTFDYFFTMQYTKTTDAPGTGRYNTDGSFAPSTEALWTGTQSTTGTITLSNSIEHFDEIVLKWSSFQSQTSDYDVYCQNERVLVSDVIYQKQGQFCGSMFLPYGTYINYGAFFSYSFDDSTTLNINEKYVAQNSDFHLLSVTGVRH